MKIFRSNIGELNTTIYLLSYYLIYIQINNMRPDIELDSACINNELIS